MALTLTRLRTLSLPCSLTIIILIVFSNLVIAQEAKQEEPNKPPTTTEQSPKPAKSEKKDTTAPTDSDVSTNPAQGYLNRKDIAIRTPVDGFKQLQGDVKHYLPENEVSAFLVGTEEYVMLLEKSITSNNKGVMIILPDWHQSAVSPRAANNLRKSFPEQGWTTMTIQPPLVPQGYPSTALVESERIEADEKVLAEYRQKLSNIYTEVLKQAKQYPGIIVVISEGNHAAMLVGLYQQKQLELPSAFVMLSSYMTTEKANKLFAQNVAKAAYPILDLVLKRDHRLVKNNAELRKNYARNEMKAYYRQKKLHNVTTAYYPSDTLIKEISGWLRSIGW